jgi:hypothetical protein
VLLDMCGQDIHLLEIGMSRHLLYGIWDWPRRDNKAVQYSLTYMVPTVASGTGSTAYTSIYMFSVCP